MRFLQWLQIAFIVLKLCSVIGWSWWLVCIPIAVDTAVQIIAAIIKGISEARKPENIAKTLFG